MFGRSNRKKISDKWKLKFKNSANFDVLLQRWEQIISIIISFSDNLEPALKGGLKNKEIVNKQIQAVKNIVASIQRTLSFQLKQVIDEIER